MSTATQTSVIGVFDQVGQAQHAVTDLRLAGFRDTDIGLITRFEQSLPHSPDNPIPFVDQEKVDEVEDATFGAAVGATIGGALALTSVAVPGFGPILVGGYFAMIAFGAVGGAMVGGLIGSLVGLGVHEHYASEVERALLAGCTVVNVHTADRREEAAAILSRNGARQIERSSDPQTQR